MKELAVTVDRASAEKRTSVVKAMISSLRNGEDRSYYVGVTGYYIEGEFYSASGVSVDRSATPDIVETDGAFACTAMFPPDILSPRTVEKNGISTIDVQGKIVELVRVKLEVMLEDVWSVAEFIEGAQHDLFLAPEVLESGSRQLSTHQH